MKLAGIDLAWHGESNPTAVAVGELTGCELVLDNIEPSIIGLNAIFEYIVGFQELTGITVDAPLIIRNKHGQRACETELGRVYGARNASCHTSNLGLFPNALSVKFSEMLAANGFKHFGSKKWQLECYPHPAIIEVFGLAERLKYKKGKLAEKKEGQQKLASYLLQLANSPTLKLVIPSHLQFYCDSSYIITLKGKALKSNEDALDAVVCLYIAALYAAKSSSHTFGNVDDGYIWVPKGVRI